MSSVTIQRLRSVNQYLRTGLARLQSQQNRPAAIAPTEFADLLAEIRCATDCLRGGGFTADPEWEQEKSEYRRNLEQLAKILPSVSGRLLVEKARLEAARAHVAKAAAWAQARTKTL